MVTAYLHKSDFVYHAEPKTDRKHFKTDSQHDEQWLK